ncbi:hypothetical protein LHA31_05050 [Carnobacterium viridans]|uniref:Scaffolding protein n=1 Tax=Carnobacterium viridans TaxID=174587 RepID=A0A1H1ASG4_9LACT|nr:hypothetical protein [Carnobacterium viridans]UDE96087.1 hypothetical protein LHA31_05050 [Carnobacterium viridans]SDQ42106.1 hypothetical protein SAMN04487752_2218 [Carnobacterium viridans]
MKEEEKELTLEELQEQLKELKAENEALKAKLEAPATEEVEEDLETPEETEETPEAVEEVPEEAPEDEDKETALQTRLEALWQREVSIELKSAGLEAFAEFINVEVDDSEALTAKVKELKALLESFEVEETYQPTNHSNTDAYSLAKAKKDPKAMLKARLG